MVTQRVRRRYIDHDGLVVVENHDVPLGAGRATSALRSTVTANPVGQMDPGSKRPLADVSKMHQHILGSGGWQDMRLRNKNTK